MHKSISKFPEARDVEDINSQNPFDWILENAELIKMFSYVNDSKLPEYVIEYVKERSVDDESGCIQLLICKISPFIWVMQKALSQTSNITKNDNSVLLRHLPFRNEILNQSEICKMKYQFCS